jgi:hypothetical protein
VTERRFYIWISFLPLVLPLLAAAIALPSFRVEAGPPNEITKVAAVIYLAGVISAVPYAIVLAAMFWRLRVAGHLNFRRLVWVLPFAITLGFAPAFAVASGAGGSVRSFCLTALVGGVWALVVGYFYAALIESLRTIGARLGWITAP